MEKSCVFYRRRLCGYLIRCRPLNIQDQRIDAVLFLICAFDLGVETKRNRKSRMVA